MIEPAPDPTSAKPKPPPPSDKFWETYLSVAGEEDKFLPNSWESNTGGILTFTGLFAATVAAFLIESYKLLSPDSGDQTVLLLKQLISVTTNTSVEKPASLADPDFFQVATSSIAVNSLWFSSLLISLICALLSTLIQEWARDYRRDVNRRRTLDESPRDRAYNHIYVRMGIDRYGMDRVVYSVTALVHLSVLLFAVGLIIFLFTIDNFVADVAIGVLGVFLATYVVVSAFPLFDQSCPYRTPITYFLAVVIWLVARPSKSIKRAFTEPWLLFTALPVATPQEMTARSIRDYAGFLTSARFAFAWKRTSRHMMHEGERFWDLFGSLSFLISENKHDKNQKLEHIWSDRLFFETLQHTGIPSLVGATVDHFHFFLQSFSILFQGMLVVGHEHPTGHARDKTSVDRFLAALISVVVPQNSRGAREELTAQLCIAGMRNTYNQARADQPKITISYIDVVHGVLSWSDSHELMASLLFTIGTPLSIGLHDSDCCRSLRFSSIDRHPHAAASNALTTVAMLLKADHAARDRIRMPEWLDQFCDSFNPRFEFSRHLPSKQFVDVLCTAGLEHWLQSGSGFNNFSPTPESANYHYLIGTKAGEILLWRLKQLARGVNWDEYRRLSAAEDTQSLPTPTQPARTIEPPSASEASDLNDQRSPSSVTPEVCVVIINDRNGVPGSTSGDGVDQVANSEGHMGRAVASGLDEEHQVDSTAARGSDVPVKISAIRREQANEAEVPPASASPDTADTTAPTPDVD